MIALDLASALVKISRLIPRGIRPAMPAAALLVGYDEEGSVRERVARLLQMANDTRQTNHAGFVLPLMFSFGFTLLLTIGFLTIHEPHVLAFVHAAMEYGVHILK